MTEAELLECHAKLHNGLDELVACFISANPGKLLGNTSIMDLIKWSHEATRDAAKCSHRPT